MEDSGSNGIHSDRPTDDEIHAPSGNGHGPPEEAESGEEQELAADEPEAALEPASAVTAEEESEAPAAEVEPAAQEEAVAEEPAVPEMTEVPAIEIPAAVVEEDEQVVEEPAPEPEAADPVAEEPAASAAEEPAADEAVPEPEPVEAEPEPVAVEPEPEAPAAESEAPAVAEAQPVPAEVPAAAAAEPSPELAAAVEEAFEGVEDEEPLPEWVPGDWFVVHTYAGYENKVKTNLETRVHSMNMEDKIYEVVIPMEDVMEIKSGKKQVVQRKVFPGYLLVRMDLDDDSWYVVRNTPGVTGFVGSGTKPIPLSEKEVDRILQRKGVEEKPKPKIEFSPGDGVRVVSGPFANFQGVISEIDTDRSKLKVLVNIFGRETPVELGFDQVAKL